MLLLASDSGETGKIRGSPKKALVCSSWSSKGMRMERDDGYSRLSPESCIKRLIGESFCTCMRVASTGYKVG